MIHKTKKEEGKRHKTKKKQQIFRIKLRNDRFRIFGSHLKPILAVLAWFKANFGHFSGQPIRPNSVDTAWFWLNLPSSVRIEAESTRIEPSWHESKEKKKEKKKAQTRHWRAGIHIGHCTPCWAKSDSNAAPSQPCPCFIGFQMVERNLIKINKPFQYGF